MSIRVAIVSEQFVVAARVLAVLERDPLFIPFPVNPGAPRRPPGAFDADVVVLDYGFGHSLRLCAAFSDSRCQGAIVIGVPDSPGADVDALLAGARGIVYDGEPLEDVVRAVHVVAQGQVWAPRRVVLDAWRRFRQEQALPVGDAALASRLSARERQVFHFAAVGLGNKEVADRLAISEATVKVHLTHIFQKLGLRGRGELAAAYHGILQQ